MPVVRLLLEVNYRYYLLVPENPDRYEVPSQLVRLPVRLLLEVNYCFTYLRILAARLEVPSRLVMLSARLLLGVN